MKRKSFVLLVVTLAFTLVISGYFTPSAAQHKKGESETTPPLSPRDLQPLSRTSDSVSLVWTASEDHNVIGYELYQDENKIAELADTSYTVRGLSAGEMYSFRVKAKNIHQQVSTDDNSIGVIIPQHDGETINMPPVPSEIVADGPPGVTPGSGGFSGTVKVSVNVNDDEAIDRVEFYSKVYDAHESDYWKFPTVSQSGSTYFVNWATEYAPEGEAIIKAVVYDTLGQFSTITRILIVDNQPDTPQDPTWEPAPAPPANRMVGYFASWATYGSFNIATDLDASRLTHLNYAFADIGDDLKVKIGDPHQDPQNFEEIRALKTKYPHLKTIISVGGWTWSGNFSAAAATPESRAAFAESCVSFILEHGFDGVDLDWEYPVTGGGPGTEPNPADRENFPLLLQEVRERLDAQGAKDGKHYLLTIAGGATAGFANNTQLGLSQQYLDYVMIMTYDIHGPWETVADFNAPLYDAGGETYSVDQAVNAFLDAGVPADKLVMGVPFYGYRYNVMSNENNGLRQPLAPDGNSSITYNNIVRQDMLNNGFTRYWHDGSKVPYMFDGSSTFISYDDEESMRLKAEYARENRLGGIMAWELSQDHQIDLLDTLYGVLKYPFVENSADMKALVERFEQEERFTSDDAVHALKLHLIAADRYEQQGAAEKVVKHMEGFKLLLDHQRENRLISDEVYTLLKADSDYLIEKWQ